MRTAAGSPRDRPSSRVGSHPSDMTPSTVLHRTLAIASLAIVTACAAGERQAAADSPAAVLPPPATVIDSALPRDEEIRRFRLGLAEPAALAHGAPSAEALVARFARAVEARDTAALRALRIDRAEFAYLYYPTNALARPPYDLAPGLMWFQLEGNSGRGLNHVLDERGGRPLAIVGHRCDQVEREGENRVYGGCVVHRLQAPGDTVQEQLFGAIVERGNTFKFVSYSNKL
jgi:hypothetical protein